MIANGQWSQRYQESASFLCLVLSFTLLISFAIQFSSDREQWIRLHWVWDLWFLVCVCYPLDLLLMDPLTHLFHKLSGRVTKDFAESISTDSCTWWPYFSFCSPFQVCLPSKYWWASGRKRRWQAKLQFMSSFASQVPFAIRGKCVTSNSWWDKESPSLECMPISQQAVCTLFLRLCLFFISIGALQEWPCRAASSLW